MKTILIFFSFFVTGCAAVTNVVTLGESRKMGMDEGYNKKRRQAYLDSHPNLEGWKQGKILGGQVYEGMTREELMASWGEPYKVNTLNQSGQIIEKWYYDLSWARPRSYFNFSNDRLISWQHETKSQ